MYFVHSKSRSPQVFNLQGLSDYLYGTSGVSQLQYSRVETIMGNSCTPVRRRRPFLYNYYNTVMIFSHVLYVYIPYMYSTCVTVFHHSSTVL